MENYHFDFLNGSNGTFDSLFENRPAKFFGITFAIISTLINATLLSGIIWYGQVCSNRTLLNRLNNGMCWSLIATMMICLTDIFRYSVGPMPVELCFFQVVAKSTIKTQVLLFFDAFILV